MTKLLKDHKHTDFMFTIEYFKDSPGKIICAWCPDCGEVNDKLKEILQDRENIQFELMGNQSSVSWMGEENSRTMWTRMKKEELELKGIPTN